MTLLTAAYKPITIISTLAIGMIAGTFFTNITEEKPRPEPKQYQLFDARTECLWQTSDGSIEHMPEAGITSPHLTVTDYKFIGDYGFKFTRTTNRGALGVYAEGCSDTDESVLVYRISDDTPLFYRSGDVGSHEVSYAHEFKGSESASKRKLAALTHPSDLILTYGSNGNCGGCYVANVFTVAPAFRLIKEFRYDPAKYGEDHGPILKEYNELGVHIGTHSLHED